MSSPRTTDSARDIPEATVARLPVYLRALTTLADQGTATCSSEEKAEKLGEMLSSLNRLIGGAIEMGAQGDPPSPWSGVIESGAFMQDGAGVEARWTLPGELLKELAGE